MTSPKSPFLLATGLCSSLSTGLFAFSALPALAQSSPAAEAPQVQAEAASEADNVSEADIVVRGRRFGELDVEQEPVLELNEEDVEATGAESIAELLAVIAPQTSSARGRGGGFPVVLVNGTRVGSFRELSSYPPEAITKVEVLPEEVAQRFGFPPDQRVVNLILKNDYASREVELEYEGPSEGGYRVAEGEFTLLQINQGGRFNINVEASDTTLLTEAERDIIQTDGSISDVASDPDQALYRSLVSDRTNIEATANWARTFLDTGSAVSLNTTYEYDDRRALSGLNTVTLEAPDGSQAFRTLDADNPLERRIQTDTASIAGSWNRLLGDFRMTGTMDASYADQVTRTDRRGDTSELEDAAAAGTLNIDGPLPRLIDAGFDTSKVETIGAQSKVTLAGAPILLPGGEFSTTFDFGYEWDRINSSDTSSGSNVSLTRGDLEAGVNVVVPLTSRREGFADAIGDISISAQAGLNHLSDFGTLYDWSVGLNWEPFDNLELQATYIYNEAPPSLANLGNPQITTLNVPTFDFVNGETVLATIISGGNPDLLAETQKDWKFSANWELPFWEDTRFSVEYVRNRSNDVTSGFPVLTEEIEAAFPDRVIRDAGGTLTQLDVRPVTYAETRNKRLVFGLTTRGSFGKARPQSGRPQGAFGAIFRAARGQGGRPGQAGPPQGAPQQGAPQQAGPPQGSPDATQNGGPPRGPAGRFGGRMPSPEQRAQFMAFRERVCADDGEAFLNDLVAKLNSGEDVSDVVPGFDPERAAPFLARLRGEDGSIDTARLGMFRERICSFDPAMMAGRGGGNPQAQGATASAGGPPRGAGRRGGGRRGGFGGDGRGRYFFNVNHTVQLESEVLIAPGTQLLDQLAGDALGSTGLAEHQTSISGGMFRNGMGMRVIGNYVGKARINGNANTGTSDLFFDDLATLNLRAFVNLGRVLNKQEGFLNDFRVSFRVDNVFNARRKVVDSAGETPLNYQPALLDPTGRYVGIDFRKLF